MKPRRTATIAVVVLLSVGAIVVGISKRSDSSLGSEATRAVAEDARVDSSERDSAKRAGLPSFAGALFDGGTLSSSDIKGPAVIHVFAAWCSTCQGEAPAFAQLQRKHPDLNYYFVAVDDDADAAAEFAENYGWKSGPTIDDTGRKVEAAFGLSGQPHTVFVAADGSISTHKGPGSFGELDSLARAIA